MSRVTLLVVLFTLFVISVPTLHAQNPREFGVPLSATVNGAGTPSITLHWDKDTNSVSLSIYRKLKSAPNFDAQVHAALDSTATQFTDSDVEVGVAYDYRIIRQIYRKLGTDTLFSSWMGTGYISTGITVLPERRSRALVLVDSTMTSALQQSLNTLRDDLENEGWAVSVVEVPRAETFDAAKVMRVRSLIKLEHSTGGSDLGAVILVGRVPVPYSGAYALDGHTDHAGAWPADGIYGDIDGVYTDVSVNQPNTSRPAQNNVPGDGKYDQFRFSSFIKIPVGRIDFYNLPAFSEAPTNPLSEVELLKRYFARNHAYRTTSPTIKMGGIIDDNFGLYGEYFAASAWRFFSLFGGDTAVKAGDFFGGLATKPTYLMAYGCGGGNDVGAGGVGSTTDFVNREVNAVFTFLFGSYFGDWDVQNNFMRSALASNPSVLTCAWSGRPHLYLHHMALGETIGYSFRFTQNATAQNGYYPFLTFNGSGQAVVPSSYDRFTHISLLGDPTLRAVMTPVASITTVTATTEYPNKVNLSWLRPVGDADGYLVLRRRGANKKYTLLTPSPITTTSFADSTRFEGDMEYIVQAVALRSTASGTFYDYGKATATTVSTTSIAEDMNGAAAPTLVAAPNPAQSDVAFSVTIGANQGVVKKFTLSVHDMLGRTMWSFDQADILPGRFNVGLNVSAFAVGTYIVRLTADGTTTTTPLTVAR